MKKPQKSNKSHKSPRQKARAFAVQALYQWQLSHISAEKLLTDFVCQHDFNSADKVYWQELVSQGIKSHDELSAAMGPFLSRPLASITPVEAAILTVAFYELIHRPEVPFRVVINEAIDLAKCFGALDSHRFINGVLDAAAKKIRSQEVAIPRGSQTKSP